MEKENDFWVECDVCKQRLKNWVGSTPCCGSIAYRVNANGEVGTDVTLLASINGGEIKPTTFDSK